MKQTTYVHDFDNFSFFYNIIQSKLFEAEKDLKKLELYAVCKFLLADRDCGIMGNFIN